MPPRSAVLGSGDGFTSDRRSLWRARAGGGVAGCARLPYDLNRSSIDGLRQNHD